MKQKILVMDDDPSICKICTLLLNRIGYDVDTASSGEEAITLFSKALQAKSPYLAVILDLTVQTGMGGLDVVKKLITLDPSVYAIMASGASVDNMMSSYKSRGFKAVLPKPFRLQDITDCMKNIPLSEN
ncbi:MAG: response regulator [bacterium]|jgi:two-component system cell cycle sensor histidine kinase/response regulator CckA